MLRKTLAYLLNSVSSRRCSSLLSRSGLASRLRGGLQSLLDSWLCLVLRPRGGRLSPRSCLRRLSRDLGFLGLFLHGGLLRRRVFCLPGGNSLRSGGFSCSGRSGCGPGLGGGFGRSLLGGGGFGHLCRLVLSDALGLPGDVPVCCLTSLVSVSLFLVVVFGGSLTRPERPTEDERESDGRSSWHTLGEVESSLVGSVRNCLVELGNLRRPQF